jgi:hypothetical protein
MLGRDVDIAHPPLQRRTRVDRRAAAKREARIDGADAGGGYPGRGLQGLHGLQGECLVFRRTPKSVAPLAFGLVLQKSARRPDVCLGTTEFEPE